MNRIAGALAVVGLILGAGGIGVVSGLAPGSAEPAQAQVADPSGAAVSPDALPPRQPMVPPPVSEVVQSGVLIVVSKPSQTMHVFKDGQPWGSSPVSTGKRGHGTPAGVFPILQKRVKHRSNIYSNAPMPYMQRLTWSGIAIHAGYVPGYPASHGCIRLPYGFARSLFGLTRAETTTVVVTNERIPSPERAVMLALDSDARRTGIPGQPPRPALAAAAPAPMPVAPPLPMAAGAQQTIQLAAALSEAEAEAHWQMLVAGYPELAGFQKAVIPAVVGARQYWRLRVSAPGAHAWCATLKRAGRDCFRVS
ncbi:MAG: L,D-transpeptidase family protein [Novosphingobium meiothermophilum]